MPQHHLSMDATSMRSRTQLRTETASSMVFMTDSNLGQTGDRERTGHGACAEDDLVVLQLEGLAVVGGLHRSGAVCVVDGDNTARESARCRAGAGGAARLRYGLPSNPLRPRGGTAGKSCRGSASNDGDHATGLLDSLLNLLGDGEADVAATDDQDARTVLCHLSETPYIATS